MSNMKFIAGMICTTMVLSSTVLSPQMSMNVSAVSTVYSTGTYSVGTAGGSRIGSNVRSGAGTSYNIRGAATYGTNFKVTKVSGAWGYTDSIRISSGKYVSGWVDLDYCTYQGGSSNSQSATVSSDSSSMELKAARDYAAAYWSNYNTAEYRSFKSENTDCVNFCSQILHAAGLSETDKWHGSYNYSDVTSSFINSPDLIAYMRSEYGVAYYNNNSNLDSSCKDGSSFSINDIKEGDLITYNGTYGRDHAMYVLGTSGDYVLFAAHTNDRFYGVNGGSIHISMVEGLLKTSELFNINSNSSNIMYGDVTNDGKISIGTELKTV